MAMNRLQRIGNNESNFRDANERTLESTSDDNGSFVEFVCECGYNECQNPMQMTRAEYEKVRGAGIRFAVLNAAHVIEDAESIVEKFDRYMVVAKHAASGAVGEARDPRNHLKTCHVLVVDDVVEVRLLLKMLLQLEPTCTVVAEANNGYEAIKAAEAAKPDVVVLDLEMPEMDGWQALPGILQVVPHAKVIVFSGAQEADERKLVALGAFNFVPKGGDPSVIMNAIKEAALSGAPQAKRLTTEASYQSCCNPPCQS